MLGRKEKQFQRHAAVSLEDFIPQLEARLDLSFLHALVTGHYSSRGHSSIDPVVFFKLQLIMFFEDVRSERHLMEVVAALSPYVRQHINRFGRYQLDLTQPPPPLNYEIRVVTSKKKSTGFAASQAQKKVKPKRKKKKSARQMKLFS